jgi:tight adherence protein C
MDDQLLIIGCTFAAVALVGFSLTQALAGRPDGKLKSRLAPDAPLDPITLPRPGIGFRPLLERVGKAAAQPFMPKTREKQSGLRQSLARAGIYSPAAIRLVTGAKVICLCGGLVGGYAAGLMFDRMMLALSVGGLVGYALPALWLRLAIKSNQRGLTFALADAIDLMVVCVEAGLTVDAAMQRVGQELALAHPGLSREFSIAHMETRVGLARAEAMRNLGQRTGNGALQSLASMLIQADRFGTSIAQALRVYSETLRINRQHAAEEQAAKASVKMTFPLVLFIFPATFIVLAGPTIINLMNSEIMK